MNTRSVSIGVSMNKPMFISFMQQIEKQSVVPLRERIAVEPF